MKELVEIKAKIKIMLIYLTHGNFSMFVPCINNTYIIYCRLYDMFLVVEQILFCVFMKDMNM